MKVTDPKFQAVAPAKVSTDGPVRAAPPLERVSKAQSEAVAATLTRIGQGLPADRAARIRDIAHAVKKGEYKPNAQQIAERIVDQAELEARLRALLNKS